MRETNDPVVKKLYKKSTGNKKFESWLDESIDLGFVLESINGLSLGFGTEITFAHHDKKIERKYVFHK